MVKGERYIQSTFSFDQRHNTLLYDNQGEDDYKVVQVETSRYSIAPFEGKFIGKCTQVAFSVTPEEQEANGLTDNNIFILIKTPIDPFKSMSTDDKFFDTHHFEGHDRVPLRISSACLPGSLGDLQCNCHVESVRYLKEIEKEGAGVFVYMPQEALGRGLREKVRDHRLIFGIDNNGQTVPPMTEAEALATLHPEGYDIRKYYILKEVFESLGLDKFIYENLGKNDQKREEIVTQTGLMITKSLPDMDRLVN